MTGYAIAVIMLSENIQEKLGVVYHKALTLEKQGALAEAAILYKECLSLDPADHCGASVRLASLGLGTMPEKAPDAYVSTLFDQHANDFDQILTGDLGYAVPVQVGEILTRSGKTFSRMLDLGCGTGLSGMTLSPICDHATGVDISTNMIDLADERACYDALFLNEAVHFLEEWKRADVSTHHPFDLIIATDVLPYIGALEFLFAGIAANLVRDGAFAFSAETLPDESFQGKPWTMTPHQRYAHHGNYLKDLLEQNELKTISHFDSITVRYEEGNPIPGWLIVAWKS